MVKRSQKCHTVSRILLAHPIRSPIPLRFVPNLNYNPIANKQLCENNYYSHSSQLNNRKVPRIHTVCHFIFLAIWIHVRLTRADCLLHRWYTTQQTGYAKSEGFQPICMDVYTFHLKFSMLLFPWRGLVMCRVVGKTCGLGSCHTSPISVGRVVVGCFSVKCKCAAEH